MAERDEAARLKALEDRIAAAQAARAPAPSQTGGRYAGAEVAWRMVTEFVACVGIGFGLGYGLDALLETTPWMIAVFTLLGFAAGVKALMRAGAEMQKKQASQGAVDENGED
jgi:ATP synthase protein I